jgi:diaminopimelate decarboxylase
VLDVLAEGDLAVFKTAGAYGATMASTYNSRPLTAEVMVRGNEWAVIRARQPIEALMALDSLPPWLGGQQGE